MSSFRVCPPEAGLSTRGAVTGNTATTTLSGLASGTYNFTVTVSGCTSPQSADVTIVSFITNLAASVVSQNNVVCNGSNNGSVTISATGGTGPYSYRLGTGLFQGSGIFTGLSAGSYSATVRDASMCENSVSFDITEPSPLTATYITVESTCPDVADGKVTLTPSGGAGPYRVLWEDGIEASNRTDLKAGSYDVIIIDVNNCSIQEEVIVAYNTDGACLQIQEIITPNNDGFYDTWKIRNIEMYPDAEVQVFNRWGEKVFNSRNLNANPWDGTFNGKLLPTDSYHFILYLKNGVKPITGTISIIR
ncbi:MAG TPA: gliding motility-associated C-terminal domain-containing protein [Bacteroidales bacterium]|nr:gliding motility-associated C-terminal domain-containing protein [Bacteroidales bacterium]